MPSLSRVGSIALAELPLSRGLSRAASWSVASVFGEAASVALLCPILLVVGWWNGFPLIFYDTGAYLLEGLGHVFVPERAPVYSLFLRYSGAAESLWYIAIVQAVLTAFVVVEFARAEAPQVRVWQIMIIGLVLAAATGLDWYVGQIEPDCMTALAVLSLYLVGFRAGALGPLRAGLVAAVGVFAIATHPAHLVLAAGLVALLCLSKMIAFRVRQLEWLRPSLALPCTSLIAAIALVLAANYALTGKFFISRTGPVFAYARMLQDGLVKHLLDDTCPASHYQMCAFKDHLPKRADAFLWNADSPFNRLQRFHGPMEEYQRAVLASVERYPLANIAAAFRDSAIQFVKLRTGDQIEPQEWIIYSDLAHYLPRQMNSYMSARQQQGELQFRLLNAVHVPVAIVSIFLLAFMGIVSARRREWTGTVLPAFVLLALLGNAVICGVFSNPHDRYQSRLAWVPCLVVLLGASERWLAAAGRIRHLIRDA